MNSDELKKRRAELEVAGENFAQQVNTITIQKYRTEGAIMILDELISKQEQIELEPTEDE